MLATALLLTLAAASDPLAPARQGQVQCYDPLPAQKLCRAIGSYAFGADGTITSLAETRLQDSPVIVMFARSAVVIRDGKECSNGDLKEADIEKIEIDGQPLPAAALAQVRPQIIAGLPDFMKGGEPLCSAYAANADGTMTATADVGGVAHPELTATVMWVNPADGWKVVP
ncbi:hypothetical protein [Brevundimonas goettingensis]|uniref:Uncharacterized protein n=1 Tax=Brevundimonas goettingensis TaxID=2774190 RepID=A0A975C376_9CAUL|nr:hypothetical protein [Brevundimonas goettingensis]QTC93013.1 hypothetical protein IFJ75_09310 [Brevundimonas goettingensis]